MTADREKLIDSLVLQMSTPTEDEALPIFAWIFGCTLALLPGAALALLLSVGPGLESLGRGIVKEVRALSETSTLAPGGSTVAFEGSKVGTVTVVRTPRGSHGQSSPLHLMVGVPAELADRIRAEPDLVAILNQEVQPGQPIHVSLETAPASPGRRLRGYVELLVRGDSLPLFGPPDPTVAASPR